MPSQPQNEPERSNEIDLDDIPAPQLSGHVWRQQGAMLVCSSCPFSHSAYIPADRQLYGINEKGEPLLRKISVSLNLPPEV
jgi:hypothetical protein